MIFIYMYTYIYVNIFVCKHIYVSLYGIIKYTLIFYVYYRFPVRTLIKRISLCFRLKGNSEISLKRNKI